MTAGTEATVRKILTVEAPIERAFAVFTEGLAGWWPADYHIGGQPMVTAVVEPKAGGRWFERAGDGSECDWGRVLVWEPPRRVMLAWQIDARTWTFDPDRAHASEIEVRFTSLAINHTRVELEHRHFERHGEGAVTTRDAVGGPQGWGILLDRYAAAAKA